MTTWVSKKSTFFSFSFFLAHLTKYLICLSALWRWHLLLKHSKTSDEASPEIKENATVSRDQYSHGFKQHIWWSTKRSRWELSCCFWVARFVQLWMKFFFAIWIAERLEIGNTVDRVFIHMNSYKYCGLFLSDKVLNEKWFHSSFEHHF